jgi:hypothetical protein
MPGIGISPCPPFNKFSWSRYWTQQFEDYLAVLPTEPPMAYKIEAAKRIKILVVNGIWTKIDILYFWDMDTAANSLINVKANASYNAGILSTVVHSPQLGFRSMATGGAIRTNWNPRTNGSNFTQNSSSIGWCKSDLRLGGGQAMGCFDGTSAIQGIVCNTGGASLANAIYLNGITAWNPSTELSNLSGFYHIIRNSSSVIDFFNGNNKESKTSNNTNAVPNRELYFLAQNNQGSVNSPCGYYQSIGYAGGGLTDADIAVINSLPNILVNEDAYVSIEFSKAKRIIWRKGVHYLAVDATKLYYSADGGVTYPYSISVTAANQIQFAIRYSNGTIIWATFANILYKSTNNLTSAASFAAKDTAGADYSIHSPANALYPGAYYFPADYINIQVIDGKEVAVWSNYTNGNVGASPCNVWCCIDGGDVVAIYQFGQNTAYRDDGTADGGATGTLLGDAGNAVITRHGHGTGFDAANNDFYITTGDHVNECHWLKASYNPATLEFTNTILHTSDGDTRFKSSNTIIEDGFVYWGTDAGDDKGLWKAPISDIFTTAGNTKLSALNGWYAAIRKSGSKIVAIFVDADDLTNFQWKIVTTKDGVNFNITPLGWRPYRIGEFNGTDFDLIEMTGLHTNNVTLSFLATLK